MAQSRGTIVTEPVSIDIRSVEKELTNLWRKAAEGELPGVPAPVTKTILSNLLVFASSDDEANLAASIIADLASEHPTRAVIADDQPGEPGHELTADVSMFCSVSDRGRRLCGEQVRLHAHGITTAVLGTVMPVLIPDLPIYLWTPGDLVSSPALLRNLSQISDHWIIDSRRFSTWPDRFRLAVSLTIKHEPPVMLHDLAWTSISGWREAIAQHFDPAPAREYLRGIKRVEISYSRTQSGVPPIEPVILVAWMMTQLDWERPRVRRQQDGEWNVAVSTEGGDIMILLKPSQTMRQPVMGVVIESQLDDRSGVFKSAVSDQSDDIVLEASAPGVPSVRRTMPMEQMSPCNQLCRILDSPGVDRLYEKAIPMIEGLVLEIEGQA